MSLPHGKVSFARSLQPTQEQKVKSEKFNSEDTSRRASENPTTWKFSMTSFSGQQQHKDFYEAENVGTEQEKHESTLQTPPKRSIVTGPSQHLQSSDYGNDFEENPEDEEAHVPKTLKEYQMIMEQLQKENFSLKLRIFYLEECLAKTKPGYYDMTAQENIELKIQLEEKHSQLQELADLLTRAQQSAQELRTAKENLISENRKIEDRLKHAQEILKVKENAEAECGQAQLKIDLQRTEILELQSLMNQAEQLLQDKDANEAKWLSEKARLEGMVSQLRQDMNASQVQLKDLQTKLSEADAKANEKQKMIETCQTEKNILSSKLQTVTDTLSTQSNQHAQTVRQLKERIQYLSEMDAARSRYESDATALEVNQLRQTCARQAEAYSESEKRVSELKIKLLEAKEEIAGLKQKADELHAQMKLSSEVLAYSSQEKQSQLEKDQDQLRLMLNSRNQFIDTLQTELASVKASAEQGDAKHILMEREVKALREQNEALENTVQELKLRCKLEKDKSGGLEEELRGTVRTWQEKTALIKDSDSVQHGRFYDLQHKMLELQKENNRLKILVDAQGQDIYEKPSRLDSIQRENEGLKRTVVTLEDELTQTKQRLLQARSLLDAEIKSKATLAEALNAQSMSALKDAKTKTGHSDPNESQKMALANQRAHMQLLEAIWHQLSSIFPDCVDLKEPLNEGGRSISQRINSMLKRVQDNVARKDAIEIATHQEWVSKYEKIRSSAEQMKERCEAELFERARLEDAMNEQADEIQRLRRVIKELEMRGHPADRVLPRSEANVAVDPRVAESVKEVVRLLRGAKSDLLQGREDVEIWKSMQLRLEQLCENNRLLQLEVDDRKYQEEYLKKKLLRLKEEYQRVVMQMHEMAKQLRIAKDTLPSAKPEDFIGSFTYSPTPYPGA